MKKKILIGVPLVLLGMVGILWLKGIEMREIKSEIIVNAPPEKVWNVLINVNGWQSWNPTVNACSGDAAIGSALDITMKNESGGDGPHYSPKITAMDRPNKFQWRATMGAGFVFTNDKVLELQVVPTGTKVIHRELFSGLMVPLFGGKLEAGVPGILKAFNEGLKSKVES